MAQRPSIRLKDGHDSMLTHLGYGLIPFGAFEPNMENDGYISLGGGWASHPDNFVGLNKAGREFLDAAAVVLALVAGR